MNDERPSICEIGTMAADEGGDQLLATQAIRVSLKSPGRPKLLYQEEDTVDVPQRGLSSGGQRVRVFPQLDAARHDGGFSGQDSAHLRIT